MHWGHCPKMRRLLLMVIYGMFWRLWIFRNDKVFKRRHVSVASARDDIKSTVFLWASHRGKFVRSVTVLNPIFLLGLNYVNKLQKDVSRRKWDLGKGLDDKDRRKTKRISINE
ncbi:hypothetical protein LXL04_001723 [Taraxacum kok-saghyz]